MVSGAGKLTLRVKRALLNFVVDVQQQQQRRSTRCSSSAGAARRYERRIIQQQLDTHTRAHPVRRARSAA